MHFLNKHLLIDYSKNLRVIGRVWMSVDSLDKGMGLIIQNPPGYGAGLDWILKFVKRVWIKVDSLHTRPIARSMHWCLSNVYVMLHDNKIMKFEPTHSKISYPIPLKEIG
uniref:Uncharacterized protein n=1 Tax=Lactuca sativa TaxID=4236 RepID=A0A9R1W394_LACSA|nr:hypothetical protein LSAT_V11C300108910 [Lactuca sativa]